MPRNCTVGRRRDNRETGLAPKLPPPAPLTMQRSPLQLLVLLAGLLAACGPGSDGSQPRRGHGGRGILLVAVDSLRADHMGFAGYDRKTTPVLDGLVQDGVAFTQTFASAPAMIPAHAGLLTGCDPLIVRQPLPQETGALALSQRWRIPDPAPFLAEEFLTAGYATGCFVDHPWLRPALGFGRGFERFDIYRSSSTGSENDFGAAQLGRRVLDWIRSLDQDRDWFAYVHVNDLERAMRHGEDRWNTYFEPRAELAEIPPVVEANRSFFAIPRRLWPEGQQTLGEYEASYDGQVRNLDNKLGRLFALLDRAGRLEQTTVCVVGSYGIGFGESGLYLDHGSLSDVDLHVPWVLKLPDSFEATRGQHNTSLASLMDVAPTLLDLAGIAFPPGLHGRSQLPALLDPDGPPVREFAFSKGGVSEGFAVHDGRFSAQFTTHAVRGDDDLTRSWYGTADPDRKQRRRFVRDRDSDQGPGDLIPSAVFPERAEVLHAAGEEWYEWIEQARLALHAPPWLQGTQTPETLAELERRGLIPAGNTP